MDEKVKHQAENLFSEFGMSLSTAFNIFVKQTLREQRLPFVIGCEMPNKATLSSMDNTENGKLQGPFNSVKELMDALNA